MSTRQRSNVLFEKLGDHWGAAVTLCAKAWLLVHLEAVEGADDVFNDAMAAASRIDDDLVVAMLLANTAERATHHGDQEAAVAMLTESIARYRRLRAAYPASYSVEAAAHLAARDHRFTDAVRLLAAAEGMRASIDVPIWNVARERHDRLIASLRDALDPRSFEEAWCTGAGLDYQSTLDLVLETLEDGRG